MKLIIEYPKPNSKGVLKYIRMRKLFVDILDERMDYTVKDIDEAYEWLLSLVKEPEDREEAYELLMELSHSQLLELFREMSLSFEPDPKSLENSEDG